MVVSFQIQDKYPIKKDFFYPILSAIWWVKIIFNVISLYHSFPKNLHLYLL